MHIITLLNLSGYRFRKFHTIRCGFIFISLYLSTTSMMAQTNNITGVYNLRGVMEMASGFKLNNDSSFEFYFSYGALDRYGSGKWSLINNKIAFNSKPYPGKDFKMIDSGHLNNNFITITIQDKNTMLLPFVYAFTGELKEGEYPTKADSHGMIKLSGSNADTLYLLFELVPERVSSFAIDTKTRNNFVFTFEPWAVEVFFKDFELTIDGNDLTGKHPIINKEDCLYEKEE